MDQISKLKASLSSLEVIREDIMLRINELGGNEKALSPSFVYPVANIMPLKINESPVFRIKYDGMLPTYNDHDHKYQGRIRQYYLNSTFQAYDFKNLEIQFNDALVFIRHGFTDLSIRDLDNRNRKYLIDALRLTRLIKDDNWRNLSIYEEGTLSNTDNYVEVFILETNNLIPFIEYLSNTSPKKLHKQSELDASKQCFIPRKSKSIAAVKKPHEA